jgi:hypothetical protein
MAGTEKLYIFRDSARLTKITVWSIYILMAMQAISAISVTYDVRLLQLGAISDSDQIRQGIVILFLVLTVLVSGVLTLVWIYRSCANAHALTSHAMEFTPGWAVGWNFVPFALLWKPFQAIREIWNVSKGSESSTEETPVFMRFWWGLWLVGNFADQISFRLTGPDYADTIPSCVFDVIGSVLNFGSCALLIMLMRQIAAWQEKAGGAESVFA